MLYFRKAALLLDISGVSFGFMSSRYRRGRYICSDFVWSHIKRNTVSRQTILQTNDVLSFFFEAHVLTDSGNDLRLVRHHDDVIKWEHFPRYWPFVRGIHRSPLNSPHKGQWRRALMFSLICVWINGCVKNRKAGDLRRYRAHYDVTVVRAYFTEIWMKANIILSGNVFQHFVCEMSAISFDCNALNNKVVLHIYGICLWQKWCNNVHSMCKNRLLDFVLLDDMMYSRFIKKWIIFEPITMVFICSDTAGHAYLIRSEIVYLPCGQYTLFYDELCKCINCKQDNYGIRNDWDN